MKNKKLSRVVLQGLALLSLLLGFQQAAGNPHLAPPVTGTQINFIENSWGAAQKRARQAHKYIFVDAYATWCGPCKQLKATTFRDPKVADFFNRNFVNLSLDMEKGEGPTLAETWQVTAYPTLLVIDPLGKVVLRYTGFLKPNDLLMLGEQALKKGAPKDKKP